MSLCGITFFGEFRYENSTRILVLTVVWPDLAHHKVPPRLALLPARFAAIYTRNAVIPDSLVRLVVGSSATEVFKPR